jgi:hypothetical protein
MEDLRKIIAEYAHCRVAAVKQIIMYGYAEEEGRAKVKMWSLSGRTGKYPRKPYPYFELLTSKINISLKIDF